MTSVGYRTVGKCDSTEKGYGVSGSSTTSKSSVFCVNEVEVNNEGFPKTIYYQVKVFFSIDLPVFRQIFTYGLRGSTKRLFYPVTM